MENKQSYKSSTNEKDFLLEMQNKSLRDPKEHRYLYHASQNKNIETLEPRAESFRDPGEGPVVFASDDKAYVSCFLVPTRDSNSKISIYRSDQHPTFHIMCISDEESFKKADKGGAIYYLSPEKFYLDSNKGNTEWTSREKVRPIKKEIYDSGLDAMIENGVYVYFCDNDTLQDLKKDPSDITKTMKILKNLVSENEKRGLENLIHKYY